MVVALIIGMNLGIAIAGFYTAWRVWRWRRSLAAWVSALDQWEREARSLPVVTAQVLAGQLVLLESRWRYRQLNQQFQQMRTILGGLQWLVNLWYRWRA